MSDLESGSGGQGRRAAGFLARAGWHEALDLIVRRLCHDLNGRVSSLQAAAELDDRAESRSEAFNREATRLEATARVLRLLHGDLGGEPIPIAMGDVLEMASALAAKTSAKNTPPVVASLEEDLPAILVNDARVVRGLVLLMTGMLGEGFTLGGPPRAERSDEGMVHIAFDIEGRVPDDEMAFDALWLLFAMDGGELVAEDGALVVRLPTLAAARTRERVAG